ncbi:hypothetical protein [Streptomyces sp. NBC_00669]|uniref:hypothetical protein n=1 Tax=Streptomyces sp. NBC_00669 TaxID=2976011 RepID=UPI002E2F5309|nr:hypothetical protein [Streptomyces sp. NBC_00669]
MPLMPDGWEEGLLPRLTELYKDLHAHPELSFQERRTAARRRSCSRPRGTT